MKTQQSLLVLDSVLTMMEPLVLLLLRHGVSYVELAEQLKVVFLAQALAETQRIGAKQTDSALSLVTGLQRRDVQQLREHAKNATRPQQLHSTTPAETVGRWLGEQYPDQIPYSCGDEFGISFEKIVNSISKDKHPRAVLDELLRIKVVEFDEKMQQVSLSRKAFLPDEQSEAIQYLFRRTLGDHLLAAVHNISTEQEPKFLEQAVFANGLTAQSTAMLHTYARKQWENMMQDFLKFASSLCLIDADTTEPTDRFTVGMYAYSTPENP
jgi:hypothetical protein